MTGRGSSLRERFGPAVAARWAATRSACTGGWRRVTPDKAADAIAEPSADATITLDPRVASAIAALPQPEVAANLDERQLALPNLFGARDFPRFLNDAPEDESRFDNEINDDVDVAREADAISVEPEIEPQEPAVKRFDASALRSSAEFEIAAASAVVVGLIFLVLAIAGLILSRPEAARDLAAEIAQRRAELPQFRAPAPCVKRPCGGPEAANAVPPQAQAAPPAPPSQPAQPVASAPPAVTETSVEKPAMAQNGASPSDIQAPVSQPDLSAPGIVVDKSGNADALSSAARSSITDWVMSPLAAPVAETTPENESGALTLEWQSEAPAPPSEPRSLPNFAASPSAQKSIATSGKPVVRKRAAPKRTAKRAKPQPAQSAPAAVAQKPPAPPVDAEPEVKQPGPKLGSSKWPPSWSLWPTKPAEPTEPAPSFGFGGN